jgi:immune inhibitor A
VKRVGAPVLWRFAPMMSLTSLGLLGSTVPTGVEAQDIQELARRTGLALPADYYEEVRRDPTAYEFRRALFRRAGLRASAPGGPAAAPARTASHGVVRLPVVLALFSDSPTPAISREMVQRSLFDGPAPRGTVTDAYLEISRAALEVRGDVFDWVRAGITRQQAVGTGDGLGQDRRLGEYFFDALDALDATVDFSVYDNDGPDGLANSGDDDGFVDVVTFEFSEVSASCGGPAIWPHRWTLGGQAGSPYATNDLGASGQPIRIDDYITQSVADCTGQVVQDAGTMAHEFGHALGLPDYYHPTGEGIGPQGRRWVLGCWELMAAGAWGCGRIDEIRGPFGPTHMSAHVKHLLGWVDYVDVGEVWNHEVVLDPVASSGLALRVPMGDQGHEFLVAEYRTRTGFDREIPAEGVLLYKVDTTAATRPPIGSGEPYYLTLLEQDGTRGLQRSHLEGGDRGMPGDAWGVAGASSPLNAETTPALRLSSGARTPVMVHEVRVEGGQARLVLSTGRTPRLFGPAQPIEVDRVRSFLTALRIAGGTGPYVASGTLPSGVFLSAAGDELFIGGSVTDAGPHALALTVRDAGGNVSEPLAVTLTASVPWTVGLDALLQRFLVSGADPLTPGELDYLDTLGNGNGGYDVGDLRKWLRERAPTSR